MHNHWNSEINAGTSRTCSFTGGLHAAAAAAATTGAAAASAPSDVIAAVRRVMAAVRRVRFVPACLVRILLRPCESS